MVDGILGLDFLKSNDCTLNIADCSLILKKKTESDIPCHYKGTLSCYRITLSENLTFPPLSEMLAFCSITKTDTKCTTQSMCIVELCKQFEGSDRALVARAFFTSNSCNKVLVRILNVHNEIQSLKKGTYIAELNPVDEVFEVQKGCTKDKYICGTTGRYD